MLRKLILGLLTFFSPTLFHPHITSLPASASSWVSTPPIFKLRHYPIAAPLSLRIESPAEFGSRVEQVSGFAEIRRRLKGRGSTVQLIADEWCNTRQDLEEFLAAGAADLVQLKMPDMGSLHDTIIGIQRCREAGVGVYLGGSCAETDLSARVSVHIAVAAQVDVMLAKPGMGVDEGHMIVANEQARLLAWLNLAMNSQANNGSASPQRSIFSE